MINNMHCVVTFFKSSHFQITTYVTQSVLQLRPKNSLKCWFSVVYSMMHSKNTY